MTVNEYLHNDGPWEVPDNFRKANAVLRYSMPVCDGTLRLTGMAYQGKWTSTDQSDARGVTLKVDPKTGDPVDPATLLVRSKGAELGLRTEAVPDVHRRSRFGT